MTSAESTGQIFSPLYFPKSVEELLAGPFISKLMLGFTAAVNLPIALADIPGQRYGLFHAPEELRDKHFSKFCGCIRSPEVGLDQECIRWDSFVASVLLGKLDTNQCQEFVTKIRWGEEFRPTPAGRMTREQLQEIFNKPFPCHASVM
jgi:hypothetical protein